MVTYFSGFFAERQGPQRVAVVGLGAGTLGCYGAPEDTYDFYEIDPTVLQICTKCGVVSLFYGIVRPVNIMCWVMPA